MKLHLDQTYIYAGKFYGPGEVEIEDEAAAKSIKAKLDAAAKAAKVEEAVAAPEPESEKPAKKA